MKRRRAAREQKRQGPVCIKTHRPHDPGMDRIWFKRHPGRALWWRRVTQHEIDELVEGAWLSGESLSVNPNTLTHSLVLEVAPGCRVRQLFAVAPGAHVEDTDAYLAGLFFSTGDPAAICRRIDHIAQMYSSVTKGTGNADVSQV